MRFALARCAWLILGFTTPVLAGGTASPPSISPLTSPPAAAAPTQPAGPDSQTQDLQLALDPASRMTLAVMINGQGPFEFLVDTGSDRTVISRELAAQLKLRPGPQVVMHDPSGAGQVETAVIDRLMVGARTIKHIDAPVVEAANVGEAGILGVDALKDLHLIVDFQTMQISTSPSREEPVSPDTIIVYGKTRAGHLILADGSVHGRKVWVVVDTGSEVSVGNPALLQLLDLDKSATPSGQVRLVSATGGVTTADLDLIADANIGDLRIHNMQLAFVQDHIFDHLRLNREPAILLGMDILRLCRRITVDVKKRQASFTLASQP